MNYKFFNLFFPIILAFSLSASNLQSAEIRSKIVGSDTTVEIRFDKGRELWAKYTLAETIKFLIATNSYFDKDITTKYIPRKILIVGRGDKVFANGVWVKAINNGRDVQIEYDVLPIGNSTLLYHELGHFFQLGEGSASFLPLAMYYAGHLKLSNQEIYQIGNWWQFRNSIVKGDFPISKMKRDMNNLESFDFTLAYGKTFKLNYIVFLQIGATNFQLFLNSSLRELGQVSDMNFPISILERDFKNDWKKNMSGWFFPGEYITYTLADFNDSDFDGLNNFEEKILGSNINNPDTDEDGVSDSYEFIVGSDILSKDNWKNKNLGYPITDGLKSDWDNIPSAITKDGKNNYQIPDNQNLIRMKYFLTKSYLYIIIETKSSPVFHDKNTVIDILVDTNLNSKHGDEMDMDIAFSTYQSFNNWIWLFNQVKMVPDLKTGAIDCYEFQIPINIFKDRTIKILPILRDGVQGKNLSEWHEWVEINL